MSDKETPNNKRTLLDRLSAPLYSSEFPEDYGDFILKSSDGVLLCFPRILLAHASPVFKDMLQIGQGSGSKDTLVLSEDRQTLECLLCHIDPAKQSPKIDWDIVTNVLTAAEKYQIRSVLKSFEKELAVEAITRPSFAIEDPVKCFRLAMHFNLPLAAQLSLRQLIRYPLSDIQVEVIQNYPFLGDLFGLRNSRIQWLIGLVFKLDAAIPRGDRCQIHPGCCGWVPGAVKAIILEPSWEALVRSVKQRPPGCYCIVPKISMEMREEAISAEMEHPQLLE
jgi:hypothetical protein